MTRRIYLCLWILGLGASGLSTEADILNLTIGDPERRDRQVPLVLDAITDSQTGELITPAELPARLADVDLLLVGETHTHVDSHLVQHRIVHELDRAGRRVMIGLEMFPYTHQEHLDHWVSGLYSEDGFLELGDWYGVWGYHWNYYRDVFLLARERGLPMFGVNTPRDVVSAVREKGFQDLTEEEAAHIPSEINTDSEEHLTLFKAHFGEDDPIHSQMSDDDWKSMQRAQCTWDATMGYNAVQAFESQKEAPQVGGKPILVVLTGSGHVSYGLGIKRQATQWFEGKIASVIPVSIVDREGEPVDQVQASYANFLWGIPEEEEPLYPTLGISTREGDDGLWQVIYIFESSPAEQAGFQLGDVLMRLNGVEIRDKSSYNRLMAAQRWGDSLSATIRRDDQPLELTVFFRRSMEARTDDSSDG